MKIVIGEKPRILVSAEYEKVLFGTSTFKKCAQNYVH